MTSKARVADARRASIGRAGVCPAKLSVSNMSPQLRTNQVVARARESTEKRRLSTTKPKPLTKKSRAITNLEKSLKRVRVPSTPPDFASRKSGLTTPIPVPASSWQARFLHAKSVTPRTRRRCRSYLTSMIALANPPVADGPCGLYRPRIGTIRPVTWPAPFTSSMKNPRIFTIFKVG